jgi:hypothetical protein
MVTSWCELLDICERASLVCVNRKVMRRKTSRAGVLVSPRHLSPSTLNEIANTHISHPHQHTELVVIWVHPPGGPGWGGARDLDFLIKESIMRIRNRPSDNPIMLLRRRKQNEEDTGGGLDPKCHTTEMSLAKDLPARWFPFPLLLLCRSWSNPDVHRQNSRESRRAVPALISRRGRA